MDIIVIQFVDIMWFGKLVSESDDVLVIAEPIEAILDRRSGKLALGSIPFVMYTSDESVVKRPIYVNKKSITVRTWWIGDDNLDKVYDAKITQVRASKAGIVIAHPNTKV
jgi:hypothetical protein